MSRRTPLLMLLALALVAAAPAFAGKGGNSRPNSSATSGSSISIASIDGVGTTTAKITQTSPSLGSVLTFNTTVESLGGTEYPMVVTSCYQDVNGDGTVDTTLLGPDLVYAWLDKPTANFKLGADSSTWTLRGGGDAVCRAELDAYGTKGGTQSIRVLASTGDWNATG